jgi:DHA1 family multidrug resistance protein-like MFS transporter
LESWKKNLITLSIAQFIYRAATRSVIPFLPFFIKEIGHTGLNETAIWSGWIYSAPFVLSFFVMPFWGSIGDKYGRKTITLFAALGFAATHFLMGLSSTLPMLLIFASLQEAFGGFYPASVSLIAANTPEEKTSYALGMLQSSSAAGNVAGPLLGGLLAYFSGFRIVFFVVAGLVVLSATIIFIYVEEKEFKLETHKFFSLPSNIKYLQRKNILLVSISFLFIYSLGVTLLRPNFVSFINSFSRSTSSAPAVTGIILSIFGSTAVVSAAFLGKLTKIFSIANLILMAAAITTVGFVSIPLLHSLFSITIIMAVGGAALGMILPLTNTLISQNVDDQRKAGIFGIGSSFSTLGNLLGGITSGYIVVLWGLNFPFVITGLLFILMTVMALLFMKGNKLKIN